MLQSGLGPVREAAGVRAGPAQGPSGVSGLAPAGLASGGTGSAAVGVGSPAVGLQTGQGQQGLTPSGPLLPPPLGTAVGGAPAPLGGFLISKVKLT